MCEFLQFNVGIENDNFNLQAEINTAKSELATAVFYETDKTFPSNAFSTDSTLQNKFKIIAEKIISSRKDDMKKSPANETKEVILHFLYLQNFQPE